MKTTKHPVAPIVLSLALLLAGLSSAHANVILGGGGDRSACPDPSFGACYIGVDGARAAEVPDNGSATFSFVGLGVQSSELPGVTFPAGPPASPFPSGSLVIKPGATLSIAGTINPARPFDVALFVGLGNNSTGNLFVNGGTVQTPIMLIGEQDTRVSQGSVTVANGGHITASLDSASGAAPVPGLTAIGIGRGLGSSGDLSVTGIGSSVSTTAASVSIGRAGTATLQVTSGASFASAGSLYASAADPAGTSSILVSGAGSTLSVGAGGHVLVGIAADPATGSQLNQGFLPTSTAHGTATLNVTTGGVVNGAVVVGAGGTMRGNGTINGSLSSYGGTLSPGNSPGTLHVNGDFLMDGGVYLVEVAGTGAGMTDLIDVTGSASLTNATILFSFINGFAPSAGFTFDFLQASQGLAFSNLTFQTQGLLPGFVFGTSTSNGAFVFTARTAGLAIPEPETLPLMLLGLAGALVFGRRRMVRGTRVVC
jgi:T5SS/PEP-CTERM-associated repeat protein